MTDTQPIGKKLKIALVHDFLVSRGGAERVLEVLAEMTPGAPIYTLLYDAEKFGGAFPGHKIYTSFLQKFPGFLRRRYRLLLPFFPVAIEALDLRDYDVVISSSSAWSKGIVTRLNTKHIAYIHSPMRYAWDYHEQYLREMGGGKLSLFKRMMLSYLRVWDREAADRPDMIIANSRFTQSRIRKYYRRESTVIYPPCQNFEFRISNFKSNPNDKISNLESSPDSRIQKLDIESKFEIRNSKFFLIVSRLTANKKIDMAIEAFNKLDLPLLIVGEGADEGRLRELSDEHIRFLGWQDEGTLTRLYSQARALIFPSEDDFGMVIVEALQCGTPVIAYKKGGATEILEEGVTGEFFSGQSPAVLADGVRRFLLNEKQYDKAVLRGKAAQFSKEKFQEAFQEFLKQHI